jgi:hypothetical protein
METNKDYLMVALLIFMLTTIVSIMLQLTFLAAEHSYTGVAITFAAFTGVSIWMLLTYPLSYFRFLKSRK